MEVLSYGLKRCPHCCQKIVWRFFSHFVSLGLRIWCGRRQSSFSSLTTVQVSLNLFVMTETTWASFRTLSMCFPLNTLSHFALHGGFLSCLTLGDWFSFHNVASDSEVSSSHHLINMKFYRCLPSWTTCLSIDSNGFLTVQQRQDGLKLSFLILTCTIIPRSFLKAYHVLIIELDPIERRNLKRRHSANENWTNLRVLVPLHKLRLHGHAHRSFKQFCLFLRNLLYLWAGCSSRLTLFRKWTCLSRSLFNADAIIASSISQSVKSLRPVLDCCVIRSSIDLAIPTSLINCIVRWGSADFEHTSVLKLTFQNWNSIEPGNFHKCNSEIGSLGKSITPL